MNGRTNLKTWLVTSVFFLAIGCATALGDVFHVDSDASPGGDGNSWATALKYLQDALAVATIGDEIWVAQGTYNPDRGVGITPGDREATFQLINSVTIKGGYAGFGEPDPNARDIELYETILSGDLDGDDGEDFANYSENSYHVVTSSGTNRTAVLNGFTITAGNADGAKPHNYGGGLYNEKNSSSTLSNCTFIGNFARDLGGGMYNRYESSPALNNCMFSRNLARRGGGMYIEGISNPVLTNCAFSENSTYGYGGGAGICNRDGARTTLTNCTFRGNSSAKYGGGMWNFYSMPTLTNCVFYGNSASDDGGGMRNYRSYPTLTNCTFSGNSSGDKGGGIHNWRPNSNGRPKLANCIIWGNSDKGGVDQSAQIQNEGGSTCVIDYCCIQGWTGSLGGTGNIGNNPLFLDPDNDEPNKKDYHLLPNSLCIDAGDNTAVPADTSDLDGDGDTVEPTPWDIDGRPRFIDDPCTADSGNGTAPIVDMGAYEANYIEVEMKFTPQALNLGSKGKWVKAHFVLPEGFSVEDVNTNTPAVIALLGIESDHINVFINDELVEIKAAFSRSDFCGSATSNDGTEVIVIGLLNSGQNFYGTDTIRIIDKSLEYVAVLAAHWLEADCGKPDWCNDADLDQSSVVNFVDFALFDGCCIEVIEK